MKEGFTSVRAAPCPNCGHTITMPDKSVVEIDCPKCGMHFFVQHDPNQEQVFPIGGGLFILMNLN